MSGSGSHKRQSLTLTEKLHIIEECENNPEETRVSVANRLGLPVSTVKTIFLAREEIKAKYVQPGSSVGKRSRSQTGRFDELEKVLFEWFRQQRSAKVPISGPILKEKALEIAKSLHIEEFRASDGWLGKFKNRNGITGRTICGEAGGVNDETVNNWMESTLPEITKEYCLTDIYNFDETGLFFNLLPNKTLAEKNDPCQDGKRSKQRLTVLVGTNADGSDKQRLLVIGRSRNPRCFRGVRSFPTDYESNTKAWMTSSLFEKILVKLDSRMRQQKRKILVFVDNCAAHPKDIQLTNIRLEFFPPNCTSRLQPLDLGIIASLKVRYRQLLVQKALLCLDGNQERAQPIQIDVLEAMKLIGAAWSSVTADTISKCFRKAGMAEEAAEYSDEEDEIEDEGTGNGIRVELNVGEEPEGWQLISSGQDYTQFIRHDEGLAVCNVQSIADIIADITEKDADLSSEDENEKSSSDSPTFAEAMKGFETASKYLMGKQLKDDEITVISKLANILYNAHTTQMKQTSIAEHFKR